MSRDQILTCGFSKYAIRHRLRIGRLHRVMLGVYAVGAPDLSRNGRWMAAVLRGGPGTLLSHESAAALWGIEDRQGLITISLPAPRTCGDRSLVVHSVHLDPSDLRTRWGIPVTSPARTLIDLAATLGSASSLGSSARERLEHAINAADRADLIDPERLRAVLADRPGLRGVPALRRILDRRTFAYTASGLERRLPPLARRAGLPKPRTRVWIEGFEVDFFWPDLGLVVETDSLRYHRTPSQLERDSRRDQAHAAIGLRTLRFSHSQLKHEPESVVRTLAKVGALLRRLSPGSARRGPRGRSTSR